MAVEDLITIIMIIIHNITAALSLYYNILRLISLLLEAGQSLDLLH